MNWFRTATLTGCIAEWVESAKGSLCIATHHTMIDCVFHVLCGEVMEEVE